MSGLLNGQWVKGDVADGEIKGGAFEREPTKFRHWLTADGEPGPRDSRPYRPRRVGISCSSPTFAPGLLGP